MMSYQPLDPLNPPPYVKMVDDIKDFGRLEEKGIDIVVLPRPVNPTVQDYFSSFSLGEDRYNLDFFSFPNQAHDGYKLWEEDFSKRKQNFENLYGPSIAQLVPTSSELYFHVDLAEDPNFFAREFNSPYHSGMLITDRENVEVRVLSNHIVLDPRRVFQLGPNWVSAHNARLLHSAPLYEGFAYRPTTQITHDKR